MPASRKPKKDDRSAATSRELFLDVAERLMSERGYAATPVSAICDEAGLAATSLYWYFGSKEGLLATVMERGAARWFSALPRWEDLAGDASERLATIRQGGAAAVSDNPIFLRLFYMLALERTNDEQVAALVGRVRGHAIHYFREVIAGVLAATVEPEIARAAARDLTPFAVAVSDGCFFAAHLEPADTDLQQMYTDLVTALLALAPAAVDRAGRQIKSELVRKP